MKRALSALALLAGAAIAQAPAPAGATVPQLYVAAALPGDTSRVMSTVIVDAPLALGRDAAGRMHLGAYVSVRGEVPAVGIAGVWMLAHKPVSGASCWRNGLRQTDQPSLDPDFRPDFALAGAVITSEFWRPLDTLVCDYEYAR